MKWIIHLFFLLSGFYGLDFISNCVFSKAENYYDAQVHPRGLYVRRIIYGEVAHVMKVRPKSNGSNLTDAANQWALGDTPKNLWLVFQNDSSSSGFKSQILEKCTDIDEPAMFILKLRNFNYSNPDCLTELGLIQSKQRRIMAYACNQKIRKSGIRQLRINNAVYKESYIASYEPNTTLDNQYRIADYHWFILRRLRCSTVFVDINNGNCLRSSNCKTATSSRNANTGESWRIKISPLKLSFQA